MSNATKLLSVSELRALEQHLIGSEGLRHIAPNRFVMSPGFTEVVVCECGRCEWDFIISSVCRSCGARHGAKMYFVGKWVPDRYDTRSRLLWKTKVLAEPGFWMLKNLTGTRSDRGSRK